MVFVRVSFLLVCLPHYIHGERYCIMDLNSQFIKTQGLLTPPPLVMNGLLQQSPLSALANTQVAALTAIC